MSAETILPAVISPSVTYRPLEVYLKLMWAFTHRLNKSNDLLKYLTYFSTYISSLHY